MNLKKNCSFFVFISFIFLPITAYLQPKRLKIGDVVPDIKITNIVNHSLSTANLSDFKGKLVIIDFWATWCSPCIAAFPKLQALQKKYEGKMQILPVTYEKKEKVVDFLGKLKTSKGIDYMSATNDNVLSRLFRHKSLPHYVWIDAKGTLLAITEGKDVTEENIDLAIKGQKFEYTIKSDYFSQAIVGVPPVFSPGVQVRSSGDSKFEKLEDTDLIIHSSLTKYVDGLSSGVSRKDSTTLAVKNLTIKWLYQIALSRTSIESLNISGLIVDFPEDSELYELITGVVDGRELTGLESEAWIKEHGYCYGIKVPPSLAPHKTRIMLNELNQYFGVIYGIEGRIEKRKSKYLALERIGMVDVLKSKGGTPDVQADKFSLDIKNRKLSWLVAFLAQPLQLKPRIIDETGYIHPVDIRLNCDLSDLHAVNRELKKYGLHLKEKEKIMDVAVIGAIRRSEQELDRAIIRN